ncbi:hydroxymethylglutaryl-CoA lyase [Sphingomonas sp. SRS2]|uniref:hydroxymethylglutaryl-CoA lyase n=1 Tax=Sphingomonas sp. SRS2 TaxID=133190 RepID=UPI0006184D6C|nr:hydroxymethylglutaryl-CoA lyase [Sphingomonas sp. SRS2]KKC26645.1 pyruvate carboxyltransferase [Sphingomonas sp. SRS2]
MTPDATLIEVGPRDGFQPIGPLIDTAIKIDYIRRLHDAGIRRVEATAFVSDRAVPQLSDAIKVLAAAKALPGLDVQVLVPSQRYCQKAIEAGAENIAFVLSASEKHNMNNVRRTPQDSVEEYRRLVADLPNETSLRLNLATAFDCPFDGSVAASEVVALLDQLVAIRPDAEIALCDTTGRATPGEVSALFAQVMARFTSGPSWVFHGHDTYGLGVANILAAFSVGVRNFDASFAGLGGCPFAPGATGNVATEDVVWTFDRMGVSTGIDLNRLLDVAEDGVCIPGASSGGRVRAALRGEACVPALSA